MVHILSLPFLMVHLDLKAGLTVQILQQHRYVVDIIVEQVDLVV